jgi:hypothetical protein
MTQHLGGCQYNIPGFVTPPLVEWTRVRSGCLLTNIARILLFARCLHTILLSQLFKVTFRLNFPITKIAAVVGPLVRS